jgi:dihydropteroate synthase
MMAKDTFLNRKLTLNSGAKLLTLTKPAVMAILNLTPDSFYGASRAETVNEALKKTESFLKDGATFIDLGAYSSRPGATDISVEEELKRLIPVISAIHKEFPTALLSIDTFRARVAEEGILAGAHLVNDISAGSLDSEMFSTIATLKVPYVMMHMKGTPQTMRNEANYQDVTGEVLHYFEEKIAMLKKIRPRRNHGRSRLWLR